MGTHWNCSLPTSVKRNKPHPPATKWKTHWQLCAMGLIINVIYEVSSFTASDASPSCQEFDWQFLFIYFSLYNIWLHIINSSDWNFMAPALVFIDGMFIGDSAPLEYVRGSEPWVVSVMVRFRPWHPHCEGTLLLSLMPHGGHLSVF